MITVPLRLLLTFSVISIIIVGSIIPIIITFTSFSNTAERELNAAVNAIGQKTTGRLENQFAEMYHRSDTIRNITESNGCPYSSAQSHRLFVDNLISVLTAMPLGKPTACFFRCLDGSTALFTNFEEDFMLLKLCQTGGIWNSSLATQPAFDPNVTNCTLGKVNISSFEAAGEVVPTTTFFSGASRTFTYGPLWNQTDEQYSKYNKTSWYQGLFKTVVDDNALVAQGFLTSIDPITRTMLAYTTISIDAAIFAETLRSVMPTAETSFQGIADASLTDHTVPKAFLIDSNRFVVATSIEEAKVFYRVDDVSIIDPVTLKDGDNVCSFSPSRTSAFCFYNVSTTTYRHFRLLQLINAESIVERRLAQLERNNDDDIANLADENRALRTVEGRNHKYYWTTSTATLGENMYFTLFVFFPEDLVFGKINNSVRNSIITVSILVLAGAVGAFFFLRPVVSEIEELCEQMAKDPLDPSLMDLTKKQLQQAEEDNNDNHNSDDDEDKGNNNNNNSVQKEDNDDDVQQVIGISTTNNNNDNTAGRNCEDDENNNDNTNEVSSQKTNSSLTQPPRQLQRLWFNMFEVFEVRAAFLEMREVIEKLRSFLPNESTGDALDDGNNNDASSMTASASGVSYFNGYNKIFSSNNTNKNSDSYTKLGNDNSNKDDANETNYNHTTKNKLTSPALKSLVDFSATNNNNNNNKGETPTATTTPSTITPSEAHSFKKKRVTFNLIVSIASDDTAEELHSSTRISDGKASNDQQGRIIPLVSPTTTTSTPSVNNNNYDNLTIVVKVAESNDEELTSPASATSSTAANNNTGTPSNNNTDDDDISSGNSSNNKAIKNNTDPRSPKIAPQRRIVSTLDTTNLPMSNGSSSRRAQQPLPQQQETNFNSGNFIVAIIRGTTLSNLRAAQQHQHKGSPLHHHRHFNQSSGADASPLDSSGSGIDVVFNPGFSNNSNNININSSNASNAQIDNNPSSPHHNNTSEEQPFSSYQQSMMKDRANSRAQIETVKKFVDTIWNKVILPHGAHVIEFRNDFFILAIRLRKRPTPIMLSTGGSGADVAQQQRAIKSSLVTRFVKSLIAASDELRTFCPVHINKTMKKNSSTVGTAGAHHGAENEQQPAPSAASSTVDSTNSNNNHHNQSSSNNNSAASAQKHTKHHDGDGRCDCGGIALTAGFGIGKAFILKMKNSSNNDDVAITINNDDASPEQQQSAYVTDQQYQQQGIIINRSGSPTDDNNSNNNTPTMQNSNNNESGNNNSNSNLPLRPFSIFGNIVPEAMMSERRIATHLTLLHQLRLSAKKKQEEEERAKTTTNNNRRSSLDDKSSSFSSVSVSPRLSSAAGRKIHRKSSSEKEDDHHHHHHKNGGKNGEANNSKDNNTNKKSIFNDATKKLLEKFSSNNKNSNNAEKEKEKAQQQRTSIRDLHHGICYVASVASCSAVRLEGYFLPNNTTNSSSCRQRNSGSGSKSQTSSTENVQHHKTTPQSGKKSSSEEESTANGSGSGYERGTGLDFFKHRHFIRVVSGQHDDSLSLLYASEFNRGVESMYMQKAKRRQQQQMRQQQQQQPKQQYQSLLQQRQQTLQAQQQTLLLRQQQQQQQQQQMQNRVKKQ